MTNNEPDQVQTEEYDVVLHLSADDYRLLTFALGLAGMTASREGEKNLFRDLFELTGRIMREREPKQ